MSKETIKKWHSYFTKSLERGHTWNKIRLDLILKHRYKASLVEKLIYNYRIERAIKEKKRQRLAIRVAASLLIIMFMLPFLLKPSILGMVIGGPPVTYYVDAVNGNDANDGLSVGTAYKTFDKLLSVISDGDTGYLLDGTYYKSNGFTLSNKVLSAEILITAYPGARPILTTRIPDFDTASNNKWTNLGNGLWRADYSSTIDNIYWVGAYTTTEVSLFSHSSLSSLSDAAKPEGIFFDKANSKLYLRLNDLSANPNNIPLSISNTNILSINNVKGAQLEISNLTIQWGSKGIYVYGSDKVTMSNNIIKGGSKPIDVRNSRNIYIHRNIVFMIQGNDWTWQDDTKSSLMETSALWLQNNYEGFEVSNNDIYGHFNGIMVNSDSTGEFRDIKVHDNYVHDIMDDGIEIESYCNGGEFYNNTVSDAFVAISLSPADAAEKKCLVYNNILIADKLVKWDHAGTFYTGECYKIISDNGCQNFNFTQNTCVGKGLYTTTSRYDTQNSNIWKNNIFYSTNSKLLEKSGLASANVFYDYNLYYRKESGSIFSYWNNDNNANQYSTLTAAKASTNWDGKWDIHSQQANPLFVDAANGDFRPQEGSPACTMSSTGSYVGALPCEGSSPPPAPFCGDASCNGVENCSTCEADCGICPEEQQPLPVCGDGTCNGLENCSTCEADCGTCPIPEPSCGDGSCNGLESCLSCSDDCGSCPAVPVCGDSSCNGFENCSTCAEDCGSCPVVTVCGDGTCNSNENCSTCVADCDSCPIPEPFCGDLACDADENCSTCVIDCGNCPVILFCGDGACNNQENCSTCATDCGTCPKTTTTKPHSSGGGGGGSRLTSTNTSTNTSKNTSSTNLIGKAVNWVKETVKGTEQKVNQPGEQQTEPETETTTVEPGQETPGEVEIGVGSKENPALLTSVIILAIITLIGMGSAFTTHYPKLKKALGTSQKRKQEPENGLNTEAKPLENQPKTKDLSISGLKNNTIEELAQLHRYVGEAAHRGYSRERVKNELLGVGWEQHLVGVLLSMHDSEFIPEDIPEPPFSQSTVSTQTRSQNPETVNPDTFNYVSKWIEFEDK